MILKSIAMKTVLSCMMRSVNVPDDNELRNLVGYLKSFSSSLMTKKVITRVAGGPLITLSKDCNDNM